MPDELNLLIKKWGRLRPLPDASAAEATAAWMAFLRIDQTVRLERIEPGQVSNHRGRRGCCLVGVVYDADFARIFHTRRLTGEDILHELLHVSHPEWPEEQVCRETRRLLGIKQRRSGSSTAAGSTDNPQAASRG